MTHELPSCGCACFAFSAQRDEQRHTHDPDVDLTGLAGERGNARSRSGGKEDVLPPLMILLTIVTGIVGAVAYLKLGHVFVANMTGNVGAEGGFGRRVVSRDSGRSTE